MVKDHAGVPAELSNRASTWVATKRRAAEQSMKRSRSEMP
jgi:hypothetical protein